MRAFRETEADGEAAAGKIREINRAGLAFGFLLSLAWEALRLTPLRMLLRKLRGVAVLETPGRIGGISLVEYRREGPEVRKLAIVQHGYGATKSRMRGLALRLAEAGFFVIAPDACAHGERCEAGRYSIVDLVDRALADYDFLIGHYLKADKVDAARPLIAGSSMGGAIAYAYALRGKYKPLAISASISTPDYRDLMDYRLGLSFYEGHRIVHLEDEGEMAEMNSRLAKANPFDDILALKDVAVLVQNMRFDPLMPGGGSDRLHREWKGGKGAREFRYEKPLAFFHYIPETAQRSIVRFFSDVVRS